MRIEPTGHLDVVNIRWPRGLAWSLAGNTLTMFVEKYPVKWAYFELSNWKLKFAFTVPGLFEDVRCRSKVVPCMMYVDFQYLQEQVHDCGRESDCVAGQPRGGH